MKKRLLGRLLLLSHTEDLKLHGFGMLKLVLRVFSFSGMPVADRPLGTRVREYFVTTRTVP